MPTDLLGPPGWCSGCWPHDGEVAGGAVAISFYLFSGLQRYSYSLPSRARKAGRRDADRPARAAWVVQRLLAHDGEVAGGAVASSF